MAGPGSEDHLNIRQEILHGGVAGRAGKIQVNEIADYIYVGP